MIGDLWRMVVGKYGYGTLVYGLLTLVFASQVVAGFNTPLLLPLFILTFYLGALTYKRALKFSARNEAEGAKGSLPFPGAPQ